MKSTILHPSCFTGLDLTGKKFGRLTVLGFAGRVRKSVALWHARCDCGKSSTPAGTVLTSGTTRSCGCLQREASIRNGKKLSAKIQASKPPACLAPITDGSNLARVQALLPQAREIFQTAGWKNISGIYAILHASGKLYVGSTACFKTRLGQHLHELRLNQHHNSYLQNAWNLHGEKAFKIIIVEECSRESLLEKETYWMGQTNCTDRDFGYNLDKIAIRKFHSAETKKKIASSNRGKILSEETRKKISLATLGRKGPFWSLERRAEQSRKMKEAQCQTS